MCFYLQITVTAHGASSPPSSTELEQQWRVLRFNNTRQSVSRVLLSPEWLLPHADATCLAFEYLKTMASAGQLPARVLSVIPTLPKLCDYTLQVLWLLSPNLGVNTYKGLPVCVRYACTY